MKTKVGLGIAAAVLLVAGVIASSSLFLPVPARAQPQPPAVRPPVRDEPLQDANWDERLPGTAGNPRITKQVLNIRCQTSVTPFFTGGGAGQAIPVTVEVRSPYLSDEDISLAFWRQAQLPEKVKEALERALENPAPPSATTGRESLHVLERLDEIERRLQQLEQQKSLFPK
jgi:hypothetical protein